MTEDGEILISGPRPMAGTFTIGRKPLKVKRLHDGAELRPYATPGSAGIDIALPRPVTVTSDRSIEVGLGFAAAIPEGHAALLIPLDEVGTRHGLELESTCGLIDADDRGEWMATLRLKAGPGEPGRTVSYAAGDFVLQAVIVKTPQFALRWVDDLDETIRGDGGHGHTDLKR